jgi:hypothetical protein
MKLRAILILLALSACASAPDPRFRDPTVAEWEGADFGDEPGNYDAAIRGYLEKLLQDPRSTTLTFKDGPTKTWVGTAPEFQYGYGVCVDVVERGVYTTANFGPSFFLFHNGRVVLMREGSDGERLCARMGRVPEGAAG